MSKQTFDAWCRERYDMGPDEMSKKLVARLLAEYEDEADDDRDDDEDDDDDEERDLQIRVRTPPAAAAAGRCNLSIRGAVAAYRGQAADEDRRRRVAREHFGPLAGLAAALRPGPVGLTMNPASEQVDAWCREAERLCRRAAPFDLAGRGVYVVPLCRLPAELRERPPCCGAFTHRRLDLRLRDVIGHRWAARGFACIINGDALGRDRWGLWDPEYRTPEALRLAVLELALHELAHALAERYTWPSGEEADPARLRREALAAADFLADVANVRPATGPPFVYHEDRFMRTALHLCHRANALGVPAHPLGVVGQGSTYGLQSPCRYRDALADEPARLAGRPLAAILATPPPAAFARLWAGDRARWLPGGDYFERQRRYSQKEEGESMSFMDKLWGLLDREEQADATGYRELVRQLSEGKREPDVARVKQLLRDNGKTRDDLRAAVGLRQQRIGWRVALDKLPAVEKEQAAVAEALARAEGAYRAAVEKAAADLDRTAEPLHARARQLDADVKAAQDARRQLLATAADPETLAAEADLHRRARDLDGRRRTLAENRAAAELRLTTLQDTARGDVWGPGGIVYPSDQAAAAAAAEKQEPVVAQTRAAVAAVEAELQELERERSRLEALKLDP